MGNCLKEETKFDRVSSTLMRISLGWKLVEPSRFDGFILEEVGKAISDLLVVGDGFGGRPMKLERWICMEFEMISKV